MHLFAGRADFLVVAQRHIPIIQASSDHRDFPVACQGDRCSCYAGRALVKLGHRATSVSESELAELMCSAVAKSVGRAGLETRPPDDRAVWDPYKARFLKVYKGSMRRRFLGFLCQASSPFG